MSGQQTRKLNPPMPISLAFTTAGLLGVPVEFAPHVLSSSRTVVMLVREQNRPMLVAWSAAVLELLIAQEKSGLAFNQWHDDRQNCATWTELAGCRCEVEP